MVNREPFQYSPAPPEVIILTLMPFLLLFKNMLLITDILFVSVTLNHIVCYIIVTVLAIVILMVNSSLYILINS